ncbi:hypothetical protein [Pantoea piersonii]|uniref:hypothetical protein n=1 Tax=Pantoea piersonii TaxID=2364647 RepID=UPI0028B0491F|nr:hypothetical protein [Pantoea piersonii]
MLERLFRFFENLIDPFQVEKDSGPQQKYGFLYFANKVKTIVLLIALVGLIKAAVDVSLIYTVGLVIDSLNGTLSPVLSDIFTQNQLLITTAFLFLIFRPLTSLTLGLLCDQCIRARFSPMVRWNFTIK